MTLVPNERLYSHHVRVSLRFFPKVVQTALPETKNADEVSSTVKVHNDNYDRGINSFELFCIDCLGNRIDENIYSFSYCQLIVLSYFILLYFITSYLIMSYKIECYQWNIFKTWYNCFIQDTVLPSIPCRMHYSFLPN